MARSERPVVQQLRAAPARLIIITAEAACYLLISDCVLAVSSQAQRCEAMLNKLPSGVESDSKTTALITAMTGPSLVARRLRICLLVPATRALSLAQELGSQVPWGNSGNAPRTTEPKHSRPHAPEQEKPLQLEARTQLESNPRSPQLEKARAQR